MPIFEVRTEIGCSCDFEEEAGKVAEGEGQQIEHGDVRRNHVQVCHKQH